ncbi:MAG TPA: hypothetical protein VM283_06525 [Armatimonadota bacterium]|nr:hypothetical protein [Armatimonadota bacterium]
MDFGYLLEGPTDRHGFLFLGTDGQFYFEDGTRGRFWGINVAKNAVFQPPEVIDAAVDAIARAGFNLVRLHHVDGVTGLLPPERAGTANPIDPAKLAAVDHWIAALGKRGIYVYLDLLDFRTFSEAEGVPEAEVIGRGAKPYAVFNERLIELQMDYARRLLVDHVNPETGLSYANDPTVCMVELCDENGLFLAQRRGQPLISPYWEELTRRWNFWLRARYGDTDTLRRAWTDWQGRCALGEGESIEDGTVTLQGPGGDRGILAGGPGSTAHAAGRANDMALLLNSIHRDYFSQMRHFLRERGVQVPIGAVTDFDALADLRAVHDELDYTGTNYYYDHPRLRDGQWQLPMYFVNHSPLGDQEGESFVPVLATSACADRPIVVREWGVCWPNKFRAPGMLEAIAYACQQDVDAMILFTYDIQPTVRRLDFFDVRRDPLRWGLAALGARAFERRDIARAKYRIEVGCSDVDSFFQDGDRALRRLYAAGHVARVRGRFFAQEYRAQSDLVVASGLSSGAAYPGERAVISAEERSEDLLDRVHSQTVAQKSGYDVATTPAGRTVFEWGGTLFDPSARVARDTHPGFDLADVEARGYRPIGRGEDGRRAFGLRDTRRNTWVYHQLAPGDKLRAALDALGQLYDERISHAYVDGSRYVSDTRQIIRDENAEMLYVSSPTFAAVAGALEQAGDVGALSVQTTTPIGAVVWLSLDGKPPKDCTRWTLKMLTIAVNTGEEKSVHVGERDRAIFSLTAVGEAPVVTLGKVSEQGTTVRLDGQEVARVGLVNGSWELVRDGGEYYFYCDTPGATLRLPGRQVMTVRVLSSGQEPIESVAQGQIEYPAGAAVIAIR